jgi:N-acetylglucosaminyldiphosphoundecaprenol N-acetyl-beta-D-mannosaminyltransferase|tara:strand:+ start:1103 stop:1834 length:732 start_codon:yes stop_codon:yes gene_type:complete
MKKYFNINIQFDHLKFEDIVKSTAISNKGYCCFVDMNSLVFSFKDESFRNVLNNSLSNCCDGRYIAIISSKIHKNRFKEYTGPDFFKKFIYHNNNHLIIGNTEDVFEKIKLKVSNKNSHSNNLSYLSIPFVGVNEFDYIGISKHINELSPDYIWVSLGAPKQEIFMSMLLPHINKGVMLGVGAAINYFSGEIKDIPSWIKKINLIWLYRIYTEPKKQVKRLISILLMLPKIINEEKINSTTKL